MNISAFELFKVGIGPSSSHTVGPMRAGKSFIEAAEEGGFLKDAVRIQIDLFGSLALTGKGHGTDTAVLLGVEGHTPAEVNPDQVPALINRIRTETCLMLQGHKRISFSEPDDLLFHYFENLPYHPNGMRFSLENARHTVLFTETYYSIGGGFILNEKERSPTDAGDAPSINVPFPFVNAAELLAHCHDTGKNIAQIVMENEKASRTEAAIREGLLKLWHVMENCIERGCRETGILPGGLKVKRRASDLLQKLNVREAAGKPRDEMNWLNLYALAVNEENAAGGRVVTAPTNGAAGIIPAVLNFHMHFTPEAEEEDIITYLLTATAVGILFKKGASISAAEMGCQGEVGVACSMAAGALTAVWGGTPWQVETAAEMGIEHNLGLTCDPIAGLVQIPCIERNTMGSVQAVNCAKLALMGDGTHIVSLDDAIKAMKQTGQDMKDQYKETSKGGLAIAVSQAAC